MKKIVSYLLSALLLASISVQVSAAIAQRQVIELNGLVTAYAMNASLQVCGWDANGRPAVWSHGSTTTLQTPGSTGLKCADHAYDINDLGTVVGNSNGQAVVWDSTGTIHYLYVPPGTSKSSAKAVNDNGLVAGDFTDSSGRSHACYWSSDGIMRGDISLPDVSNTVSGITSTGDILLSVTSLTSAKVYVYSCRHNSYNLVAGHGWEGGSPAVDAYGNGISDNGAVAGDAIWETGRDGDHEGFVWQNGNTVTYGGGPDWSASAVAVNRSGYVVGSDVYSGWNGPSGGPCIWHGSETAFLNDLIPRNSGYIVNNAVTINDSGVILCNGHDNNHTYASLLMTPEPSSIVALVAGIACFGPVIKRKRSR